MVKPKYNLKEINQVCVVVKDMQKAVENYWSLMGIGPWKLWTYGPGVIRDATYMGKPSNYSMRVGLAQLGSLVVELIQPLEGDNIYSDFIAKRGEGIHHFGFFVPDLDEAIRDMEALGFKVVQSGKGQGADNTGGFAYIATEDDLAAIFELIQVPNVRREPEAVYPAP